MVRHVCYLQFTTLPPEGNLQNVWGYVVGLVVDVN